MLQAWSVVGPLTAVAREVEDTAERCALQLPELVQHLLRGLLTLELDCPTGDLSAALGQVEAALGPCPAGPPAVAVVGRTRAGKSTLRFALTGEGEEGIGRGGQRTTRTVIDYDWHGVRLRDTPGVGARDGATDTQAALEAAAEADLVLWMLTSDGLQQATLQPVLQMLRRGVPVLAVVNHKDQHDLREDRDWDHDGLTTERGAREVRLRSVLADGVRPPLCVVHVQLDVARWARGAGCAEAWVAAGLPELEQTLADAAACAVAARQETRRAHLASALDGLRVPLDAVVEVLDQAVAEVEGQLYRSRQRTEQAAAQCRTAVQEARRRAEVAVSAGLDAAVQTVQATEDVVAATARWSSALVQLDDQVTALLEATARSRLTAAGWPDELLRLSAAPFRAPAVSLAGAPKTARALGAGFNVFKLAVATPALLLGPVGAVAVGLLAPVVVDAVAAGAVPQVEAENRKRAESLAVARAAAEEALAARLDALGHAADTVLEERVLAPGRRETVSAGARRTRLSKVRALAVRARSLTEEGLHER